MPPRRRTRTTETAEVTTRRRSAPARTARAAPEVNRPKITVEELAESNESLNIMVYGDSGVGKTPFAGAAPGAVFLSTEQGFISAKRFGSAAKLIRAPSWLHVEAACEHLEAHADEYQWLIVDSVPKMQTLLLRHLLEENVREERNKADLDLPSLQDHQKWQNMFKRFIDRLVDVPINTIFIATSMRVEIDEPGGIREMVLPAIDGKPKEGYAIAQYVCAQMGAVFVLRAVTDKKTDEPRWVLLTKARPPYFAKNRYGGLPPIVRQPSMPEIIAAIEAAPGELGEDASERPAKVRRTSGANRGNTRERAAVRRQRRASQADEDPNNEEE